MSSSAYSNDDASQKLVINTPAGLAGLGKCTEIVKNDLARAEENKNEAAARVYRGILAAFRVIRDAGDKGIFYAELQMEVVRSVSETRLSRGEQAEVMQIVRGYVKRIRDFESQRSLDVKQPSRTAARPQQAHSPTRERLENIKLKGRGSR